MHVFPRRGPRRVTCQAHLPDRRDCAMMLGMQRDQRAGCRSAERERGEFGPVGWKGVGGGAGGPFQDRSPKLTISFIRYLTRTELYLPFAPREPPVVRGTDSRRSWKRSSEILFRIDRIKHFLKIFGCTSQRFPVGWRSRDCGGRFLTVNSASCSSNHFEII